MAEGPDPTTRKCPQAGPGQVRTDRLRQEREILLRGQTPHVAGDEGLLGNAVRPAELGTIALGKMPDLHAGGKDLDRGLDAPVAQNRGHALAGRDDAVTEIAVPGDQGDDELAQPARSRRHVMDVILVHRVVREDQGAVEPARNPDRRVAQQVRMMGMHDVRPAFLELGRSRPGAGRASEKSLPLKSWIAGTRITSSSQGGIPSNTGATTTTRWPALRHWSAKAATDLATPPTNGVNVLVIIQMFMALSGTLAK